jgi:hypothetical protein
MPSLKEIFEKAQSTGNVEYTYFGGGVYIAPFEQTSIGFGNDDQPYIRLGYDPVIKFRSDDPTNIFNQSLAASRDSLRISRFLSDFPNGPLWLVKQTGLQLSNPDTSYKSANGTFNILDQLDGPRFYNPLGSNTLSQIPAGVLGYHYTRHGLSPTNDIGYISLNTTDNGIFESRLTTYKDKIQENKTQLNTYTGGPDSTLGLGRTTINSYGDSFKLNTGITNKQTIPPLSLPQYMDFKPWSYEELNSYSDFYTKNKLSPSSDKNLAEYPLDFTSKDDYLKNNIHARIGVTSNNNGIGSKNTVDSINILRITPSKTFFGKSISATASISPSDVYTNKGFDGKGINGKYGRDLIKFRLEFLNNDTPVIGNEINTDVLAFRAYIDNMNDNFTSQWKEFNYMGRGEPFYAYEGFKRSINLTFTILAHSAEEMAILYTKLNYLMSTMAPDYNNKNQMRGNYCYMTVGDYIYRQPGVIDSLQISDLFGDNQTGWEIALNEPDIESPNNQTNAKHYEVPKMVKIQLGFKPIHNFLPKRMNSNDTNHTATFVTPNHMLINKYNRYLPSPTINTVSQEQQGQLNAQNFTNLDQITGNLTPL